VTAASSAWRVRALVAGREVVSCDRQRFFNIAIAQGIAEISADGAENDFGFKMAPLE